MKKSDHHTSARSIIAFLVLLVAFVVLYVFYQYHVTIIQDDLFKPFVTFTVLGLSLLLGLMYLANKPHKAVAHHRSTKSSKRKRRK